jgi:hypothetical protein
MTNLNAPTNTKTESEEDPLMTILLYGGPGGVERQEAHGQQEFVASDTLPTEIRKESREVLEAAGVKFLGPVPGDDLFQYVQLPPGWLKAKTDHSMWSDLLDEKGRKRAGIFYKAAFYDRSAYLHTTTRFGTGRIENESDACVIDILDGNKVIHKIKADKVDDDSEWLHLTRDVAYNKAKAWLTERYPDWENHGAYWDE